MWMVYVAVVGVVAGASFAFDTTSLAAQSSRAAVASAAVVAVLVGVYRHRPTDRQAWLLVAGSTALLLGANLSTSVARRSSTDGIAAFPSYADAFQLGAYPMLIGGALMLLRSASPGRDVAGMIDAGLVAVASFAVLVVLYLDSFIAMATAQAGFVSILYPVLGCFLLVVVARLAAAVQLRQPAIACLSASLVVLVLADAIYGVVTATQWSASNTSIDVLRLASAVLVGAAALHPSMGRPAVPHLNSPGSITRARLAGLFLVVLVVPAIDIVWGGPSDHILLTSASMVMFTLVLLRMMGLLTAIQVSEQQARHDSMHDTLTGLANREQFAERIEKFVALRTDGVVSVLFVDLDDFAFINDNLGHDVGDEMLMVVAARLQSCIRDEDIVARLSEDEFAVLLESAVDRNDAVGVAERVQDSLEIPIVVDGRDVSISTSVGIAVERRANIERADTILRTADTAMYRSKSGSGRSEFFEQGLHLEAVERLDLRADLQVALERGQFELSYQPIVDMEHEQVRGVEALIRWHHPTRGDVLPDRFIQLAEQTGQIIPIGRWVLHEACSQIVRWRQDHPDTAPVTVSVNLSVRQLHDPDLVTDVGDALSASGLEPEALTLEINEAMLIDEIDRGSTALERLKSMNVKIAIDDFGTGYSSLAYLKRATIDAIKIDKSFIADMEDSPASVALVKAVVDLAISMGIDTFAEGVENADQRLQLHELGCLYGQGYYFARPLTAVQVEAKLDAAQRSMTARRAAPLDVEVLDSVDDMRKVVVQLGGLHTEAKAPVMARSRWIETWAETHDEWTPMVVLVRERISGQIEAAALLATRTATRTATETAESAATGTVLVTEVVSMGSGPNGSTQFATRSERAAGLLADGIADELAARGPWSLQLDRLTEGDPVVDLLVERLANAETVTAVSVPQVVFGDDPHLDDFLPRDTRRTIRRAWKRLESEGLAIDMSIARSEFEIIEMLPALEAIRSESATGDDREDELWRRLVLAHAASGQIEISSMSIDGTVAGYVIGIVDDEAYRMFDGGFATEFADYLPRSITQVAVLERAMVDARFGFLDWMTSSAADEVLATNHADERVTLTAWSTELASSPDSNVSDSTVSDSTVSDSTVSDSTVSDSTVSDSTGERAAHAD